MKRIFAVFIALICIASLFADTHDNSEYKQFQEYNENPTAENFIKAYEFYHQQNTEMSRLLLTYLHYQEMENLMDQFDRDLDNLTPKTKFSYANLLLDLGKYEESINIYDQLNTATPAWACPWRHKGEAYWKIGDLLQAETALRKSIEVRENHYDAYVMLAEVLRDAGKYAEALFTLENGLHYKAENPEYSEDVEFEQNVNQLHEELKAKVNK